MAVKLYDHQVQDLESMRKHEAFALYHEVGAGKSFPCIVRMLEWVSTYPGVALVFTEVSLLGQLQDDFYKVIGNRSEVTVGTLSGKTHSHEKMGFKRQLPSVLIVNYEYAQQASEVIGNREICAIWCDEGHRLKGFRGMRSKHGKRAKEIMLLAQRTKRRLLTTGSPVVNPNSPDIWALYFFLNPDIFGPTLWKFEQEFFYNVVQGQPFKKLMLKPHMKEEMSTRMYKVARRLLKKELNVQFPDRAEPIKYEAHLPPKVKKVYKELESMSMAVAAGEVVTRPMLLGRLMTLQQIASGFFIERDAVDPLGLVRDEKSRRVIHIDSSHKDSILLNILDNIGPDASVIIWAVFTHEIDHICKLVEAHRGQAPSRMDGQCTGSKRELAKRDFQAGKVKTLVAHPAAAGAGLNLQIAGHAIRYSRSYKLIEWEQSRGRNHRAGKLIHEAIFDHEIVAPDTYDEKVFNAILSKEDLAGGITLDFFDKSKRNR